MYTMIGIYALILALLFTECNAYIVAPVCKKQQLISTSLYMAGFGKPKEAAKAINNVPSGATACSCGSGKNYQDCCQPFHENKSVPSNPVQVLRARFSALNYGVIPFLTKTTHPDNKEYVAEDDDTLRVGSKKTKRMTWEKEIKSFADAYEFRNLKFENEESDSTPTSTSEDALVSISLERKLKSAFKYDYVEEISRFRQNTKTGIWSIVSSDMKVNPAVQKMVRSTQEKQFK